MDVSAQHARVVACLVEKAETTPDSYPLTTKALQAACNQATNRDPVVDYSERDVDSLMLELRQGGLARTVTGTGHRVGKHKHTADDALGIDGHELAVLAVLLLRGEQTLNEITVRTARYAQGPAGDADAVDAAIDRLTGRTDPLAVRLQRRPGEREPRIAPCWAEPNDGATPEPELRSAAPIEHVMHPARSPAAYEQPAEPAAQEQPAELAAHEQTAEPAAQEEPAELAAHEQPAELAALTDRVAALEAALADQARRIDALLAPDRDGR